MHTELYCENIATLDPVAAIRAIHQAWLQLNALDRNIDCEHFDNASAIEALSDCLRAAGHPGFQS